MYASPLPGLRWLDLRTPTLPPATHTRCFIIGEGALTVVDPGSPYSDEQQRLQAALDALAAAGHQVARVLLTHHHHDHVAGVAPFLRRGVPLWAHPETTPLLRGAAWRSPPRVMPALDGAPLPDTPNWSLLHTPGHAPGHLALWHAPSATLLCADLLANGSTILIDPPQGDMGLYLHSLSRARALSPRALIPSHGAPFDDPDAAIATYIAHRHKREALVLAAVRDGRALLPDIIPLAYADTPPAAWPLATRSALAHLLHLRAQGRVQGDPTRGFSPAP
jgi:glyoxylase-like metal-dependent hydrolase (beta-lactamase superfamily II)